MRRCHRWGGHQRTLTQGLRCTARMKSFLDLCDRRSPEKESELGVWKFKKRKRKLFSLFSTAVFSRVGNEKCFFCSIMYWGNRFFVAAVAVKGVKSPFFMRRISVVNRKILSYPASLVAFCNSWFGESFFYFLFLLSLSFFSLLISFVRFFLQQSPLLCIFVQVEIAEWRLHFGQYPYLAGTFERKT